MRLFLDKVCTLHMVTTTHTDMLSSSERQPYVLASPFPTAKAVCTQTQLIAILHFGMKTHKVGNEASILESPLNAFKLILAHGGNARPRWTHNEHS